MDLGLTIAEQELLNREGDQTQARVSYRFEINERHGLLPRIGVTRYDLDGESAAFDRTSFEIAYKYTNRSAIITAALYVATTEHDEEHPVFGETREDDLVGVSFSGVFPTVFPSKKWILVLNAGSYDGDSNIEFYNTRVGFASVSALFRF